MTDTEHFSPDTLDTEELILTVRDHIDTARSVPGRTTVSRVSDQGRVGNRFGKTNFNWVLL